MASMYSKHICCKGANPPRRLLSANPCRKYGTIDTFSQGIATIYKASRKVNAHTIATSTKVSKQDLISCATLLSLCSSLPQSYQTSPALRLSHALIHIMANQITKQLSRISRASKNQNAISLIPCLEDGNASAADINLHQVDNNDRHLHISYD